MKTLIVYGWLILLTLLFSGCQTVDSRGQFVEDSSIDRIKNSTMTKGEVVSLLGTPTFVPKHTDNSWYYIQRSLAHRAWFTPKVIEQRIVKVDFNKNNRIQDVTVLNDTHKENIAILAEDTKTYGNEQNIVQKFVRNIGRFNDSKTSKSKKK